MQASTEFTPFHILRGQDVQLPMQQMLRVPAPEVGCEDPTAQAVIDSLKPLQTVLTQAHANISAAQQKQMTHYASRVLHGAKPDVAVASTASPPPTAEEKGKAVLTVPGYYPIAEQDAVSPSLHTHI